MYLSPAQAFAVELGDGKLCIGSGYGMSSESRKVSRDEIAARAADLPAAARDELLRHVVGLLVGRWAASLRCRNEDPIYICQSTNLSRSFIPHASTHDLSKLGTAPLHPE